MSSSQVVSEGKSITYNCPRIYHQCYRISEEFEIINWVLRVLGYYLWNFIPTLSEIFFLLICHHWMLYVFCFYLSFQRMCPASSPPPLWTIRRRPDICRWRLERSGRGDQLGEEIEIEHRSHRMHPSRVHAGPWLTCWRWCSQWLIEELKISPPFIIFVSVKWVRSIVYMLTNYD